MKSKDRRTFVLYAETEYTRLPAKEEKESSLSIVIQPVGCKPREIDSADNDSGYKRRMHVLMKYLKEK